MGKLVFVWAAILFSSSLQAYDFAAIADQHVIPAYQHLAQASRQLRENAQAQCNGPTIDTRGLQRAYSNAFLAWQGAQQLRFGPIQYLSREHRLQLWPDKRGTVAKHMRKLLQSGELQQPDFDITGKSVAVQGFSALEQLLFASQPPDADGCLLVRAIADNLVLIADSLVSDWQAGENAYRAQFVSAGAGSMLFESEQELAGKLLNSLNTQLEFMVTQKLARPLGTSPERARGKRAEAWRSGNSLPALQHNLRACRDLYRVAFASELSGQALGADIQAGFDQVEQRLAAIEAPLAQSVETHAGWQALSETRQALNQLRETIAKGLTASLSLSLGFNALDGD